MKEFKSILSFVLFSGIFILTACSPSNNSTPPKESLPTEEVFNLDDLNVSFSIDSLEVTSINFQNLLQGQKKSVVVVIKNKAALSTPPLTATVGNKYYLTSSTCQSKVLKTNESCSLTLNISSVGKPLGVVSDTLFFGMASIPVVTNIIQSPPPPTNNASIVFYDNANVISSELDFSPVASKFSRTITIKNEGSTDSISSTASLNNSNFYITSNSCSSKKLSCPTCSGANPKTCDLTVNYSTLGKIKGQVYSSTLSFAGSSITLKASTPLNQVPTSEAILVFSDGSSDLSAPLHIGTYFNNATLSKTLYVRNIGSGTSLPFTVSLTNNNSGWYLVANSCVNSRLTSGSSCALNLRVSTSGKASADYSVVLSAGAAVTQEVLFTRFLLLNCPPDFHQEGAACVSDYRTCSNQDYLNNGVTLGNILSFEGQVYFEDYSSCLIQSCQVGYERSGDQRSCSLINRPCEGTDALVNGVNTSQVVNYQGNVLGTSVAACLIQSCNTGYAPATDRKSCYQNQFACLEADAIANGVSSSHVATYKGDKIDADVSACLINTCVAGYTPSGDFKNCEIINRSCLAIDAQGNGVNTSNVSSYKGTVLGTNNTSCLIQSCAAGYNVSINEKSCDLINRPCQQVDVISNGVNTNNASLYKGNVVGTSIAACLIDECVAGFNPANDSISCVQINRACLQADAVSNGVSTTNVSSYKGNVVGTSVSACLVNTCVAGYESALDGKSCVQINRACTQGDVLANGVNINNATTYKGSVIGTNNTSCLIQSCDAGYNVAANEKSCVQVNRACLQADAVANGVNTLNVNLYKGNVIGTSVAACLINSCVAGYNPSANEKSCNLINRTCLQADAVSNGVSTSNVSSYKGNVLGTDVSACLVNACQSGYQVSSNQKSCNSIVRACSLVEAEENGASLAGALTAKGNVVLSQGGTQDISLCLINSCEAGYSLATDSKSCIASTTRSCTLADAEANGANIFQSLSAKGNVIGTSVSSCLIDTCLSGYSVASDFKSCINTAGIPQETATSFRMRFNNFTPAQIVLVPNKSCATATPTELASFVPWNNQMLSANTQYALRFITTGGVTTTCATYTVGTENPFRPSIDVITAATTTNSYSTAPTVNVNGIDNQLYISGANTLGGIGTVYTEFGLKVTISTTQSLSGAVGSTLYFSSALTFASGSNLPLGYSYNSSSRTYSVTSSLSNGGLSSKLQEGVTYYIIVQTINSDGIVSSLPIASKIKSFTYVRKPVVFFTADNGINGRELMIYDKYNGASNPTLLKDFTQGSILNGDGTYTPKSSNFLGIYPFNNKLYVFVQDSDVSNQLAIWRYDHNNFTTPFTKITTIANVDNFNKVPIWIRNSKMWFPVSVDYKVRLYSTDGTAGGTVEELNTNVYSVGMGNFKFSADNNTFFFVADAGKALYNVRLSDKALFFNGRFSTYLGDYSPLGTSVIIYGTRSINPLSVGLFKISSFTSQPTDGNNNNWTAYGSNNLEALNMTVFGSYIYFQGTDYSSTVSVPSNATDKNQPSLGYRKLYRTNGTTFERVVSLNTNLILGPNTYPQGIDNVEDLQVINGVLHFTGIDSRVLGGGTAYNTDQYIRGFYKLDSGGTTATKLADMNASLNAGASYREILQYENLFLFFGGQTSPTIKGSAIWASGYSSSVSGLNGSVYEFYNGNNVGAKNYSPDNFVSY